MEKLISTTLTCKQLRQKLTDTINLSKNKYYKRLGDKLNNPNTSCKTDWSIIRTFVNGEKTPIIFPLLVNDKLVLNFVEKANIFNDFFSSQCQRMSNDSTLPRTFSFETTNRLTSCLKALLILEISMILQSLDQNKAHDHDDIPVRMIKIRGGSRTVRTSKVERFVMIVNSFQPLTIITKRSILDVAAVLDPPLKMCGSSIIKPLQLLFNNCVSQGVFPNIWKLANFLLVDKKNRKQLVDNYRPVSLLPIYSKIFETWLLDSIYL